MNDIYVDHHGDRWTWRVYGPDAAPEAVMAIIEEEEDAAWNVDVETPRTTEELQRAVEAFHEKYCAHCKKPITKATLA